MEKLAIGSFPWLTIIVMTNVISNTDIMMTRDLPTMILITDVNTIIILYPETTVTIAIVRTMDYPGCIIILNIEFTKGSETTEPQLVDIIFITNPIDGIKTDTTDMVLMDHMVKRSIVMNMVIVSRGNIERVMATGKVGMITKRNGNTHETTIKKAVTMIELTSDTTMLENNGVS